ncbi:hypothetical protein ACO0LV_14100 [Pseudactinotalea sp. Z1739]|uniref:hypothetical protein n=1 Tax=Pseudactinotalea sp. Z1739 TaxID=3413028 RepID=UPI003C7D44CF
MTYPARRAPELRTQALPDPAPAGPTGPAVPRPPSRRHRGLGILAGLVQFALLAGLVWSVWRFTPELVTRASDAVAACEEAGGDLSCVTSEPVWRHMWWPLAAVLATFSLFRGARVANARRAGDGLVLSLLAMVILAGTLIRAMG